jgi:hypothetical protein
MPSLSHLLSLSLPEDDQHTSDPTVFAFDAIDYTDGDTHKREQLAVEEIHLVEQFLWVLRKSGCISRASNEVLFILLEASIWNKYGFRI